MSSTMQAIRIHEFGGPEQLTLERIAQPEPGENQVLIRILAAGVNPTDWKSRSGLYKGATPLSLPWIPGVEVVGVVEATTAAITTLQKGQVVYGPARGTYAEYTVVPASDMLPKPANLTYEQAAGTPIVALTAWRAVIDDGQVQAGQRVLVHGAAGGVGHMAVQFARWKGAHVIGTASAGNAEFVRSLGAETVIDYNAVAFERAVRDVDVVVDTVGGDLIERSWQVLRPGGVLVTTAARLAENAGQAYGMRAIRSGRAPIEEFGTISGLIESGKVTPTVSAVFPFTQARQAHELSQTGHGRGRIILLTA